jgi:hypothetical protein
VCAFIGFAAHGRLLVTVEAGTALRKGTAIERSLCERRETDGLIASLLLRYNDWSLLLKLE